MRIGFLTLNNYYKTDSNSNSRIRVEYIAKYLSDSYITEDKELLKNCDVLVFQTRYFKEDVDYIKEFKDTEKVLIMDLTDPMWYWHNESVDRWFKEEVLSNMDIVICSTKILAKMYRKHYGVRNITFIPDRMDLQKYNRVKIHVRKESIRLLWHGYIENLKALEPFRNDIIEINKFHEKLYGKKLELVIVSNKEPDSKFYESFNQLEIIYKQWDSYKLIDYILDSDIVLNCRPLEENFNYKSNNKTITSWALGVPCVESINFKIKLKKLIENPELRKEEGIKKRAEVERCWDSRISAKQFERLVLRLKYKKMIIILFKRIACSFMNFINRFKRNFSTKILLSFNQDKRNRVIFEMLKLLNDNSGCDIGLESQSMTNGNLPVRKNTAENIPENYISYIELVKWMEKNQEASSLLPEAYEKLSAEYIQDKYKNFYYKFKELLFKCYRNENIGDIKNFNRFVNDYKSRMRMLEILLLFTTENEEILKIQNQIQDIYRESLTVNLLTGKFII